MIKQKSFWALFFLSIITCGIYAIVFWCKWVKDVNTMFEGDDNKSPHYIVVMLLSLITCGIYSFIWYYKMGERFPLNSEKYGVAVNENGTTVLLWVLLGSLLFGIGPLVASYILIKNSNLFADAYNKKNGLTA